MNEYQQFMKSNENVSLQDVYLRLTNYRGDVMQDVEHKKDVLRGYFRILATLERFKK